MSKIQRWTEQWFNEQSIDVVVSRVSQPAANEHQIGGTHAHYC